MEVLYEVRNTGSDAVITRYGKPIVRICPLPDETAVVSDPMVGITARVSAKSPKIDGTKT
jgi:antitoxin (DNA-binding transcriptional repressor) of toxin-antitoxin stability system